jgi:hypothetical protein
MDNTREKLIDVLSMAHDAYYSKFDASKTYLDVMADHLIANGVTFATDNNVGDKWIPVSERLPENMDDRVLVLLPTKSYDYPIGNQHIDTDRYRGEYRKWVRYGDKVTHWMPLPEPPKGE